ncbi:MULTISPECIES: hypothetical protein [Bacteria]|uniref:hypothetical protein n=1 Tax=Bacteria TaxID=2 RepID=UPI003C7D242F
MTDIRGEIARTLADWLDEGHAEAWLVEMYEDAADALMPLIRRAQAEAWAEGERAGLLRADYEYGAIGYQNVKTNPYIEAGATGA